MKTMLNWPLCWVMLTLTTACGQMPSSKEGPTADTRKTLAGDDSDTTSNNWMATYVNARVYAANARFQGKGFDEAGEATKVVGGEIAKPNDNPFQVALLEKEESNNFNAQFCGGTLIAPDVVVTAAHCSDFVEASQVQVLTGSQSLHQGCVRRDVQRIVIHPKWNSKTYDFDVAVWRLTSKANGPTASLALADGATGEKRLATGWGKLSQGGLRPEALHKVSVPVVDRTDCNDANSYRGAISDRMLCAGYSQGGKDTCQGDSGGPLTNGASLVGITSWGRRCANANFFGIYTRVSNPEIAAFIRAN